VFKETLGGKNALIRTTVRYADESCQAVSSDSNIVFKSGTLSPSLTRGSHHIVTRSERDEIINLQPKGSKAKTQVIGVEFDR